MVRAERITSIFEFLEDRYSKRKDKDNIFGVGISDIEFRLFIMDYLLGADWYVVDPLGHCQVTELALLAILEKYSRRYRKERKKWEKKHGKERLHGRASCRFSKGVE